MKTINEQVLYVIEPCLNTGKCPGCFLERKQTTPIEVQFKEMNSETPTVVTLNDLPIKRVRQSVLKLKKKFKNLRIHCTTRLYGQIKDMHSTFTCSISTKLDSIPVINQEVMLTIYPGDSIQELRVLLEKYKDDNSIVINFTKPWTNFKKQELINYLNAFKNYKIDECSMFHLLGQGICIAQKGTVDFYTNGKITKCPYYMDEICEKATLFKRVK